MKFCMGIRKRIRISTPKRISPTMLYLAGQKEWMMHDVDTINKCYISECTKDIEEQLG